MLIADESKSAPQTPKKGADKQSLLLERGILWRLLGIINCSH